jgi:DNA-directed RNA polymerase subunit alpha
MTLRPRTIRIDASGEGIVTANDITSDDGHVEVLNPTITSPPLTGEGSLKMTMVVKAGKGYALAEANKDEDAPIGTIPIDAVFSPIKRVNYVVGQCACRATYRL